VIAAATKTYIGSAWLTQAGGKVLAPLIDFSQLSRRRSGAIKALARERAENLRAGRSENWNVIRPFPEILNKFDLILFAGTTGR
jgi:hypothetical protein